MDQGNLTCNNTGKMAEGNLLPEKIKYHGGAKNHFAFCLMIAPDRLGVK